MEFLVAEVAVRTETLGCSITDYVLSSKAGAQEIPLLWEVSTYHAFYSTNDYLNCSGKVVELVHLQDLLLEGLLQFLSMDLNLLEER
jgi:hypothetical protein